MSRAPKRITTYNDDAASQKTEKRKNQLDYLWKIKMIFRNNDFNCLVLILLLFSFLLG